MKAGLVMDAAERALSMKRIVMIDCLQNNWFWIVVFLFFIWMHSSGMGCGHGSQGDRKRKGGKDGPR